MQVHLHTDASIDGSQGLAAHVTSVVENTLGRFRERLTRVEVHLSDENGDKGGENDKRCSMEARLDGRPPTGVTCHGPTIDQALKGAVEKLERALDSAEGRRGDKDHSARRHG